MNISLVSSRYSRQYANTIVIKFCSFNLTSISIHKFISQRVSEYNILEYKLSNKLPTITLIVEHRLHKQSTRKSTAMSAAMFLAVKSALCLPNSCN